MAATGEFWPHLALGLVGVGLLAWGGIGIWHDQRVPAVGVPATALVTAAHVPDPGKGPATKVVFYEYQAGDGATHRGTAHLDAFSPVEAGSRIPVHYLARRPQVSRAFGDRGGTRFHALLLLLGGTLLSAGGWLLLSGWEGWPSRKAHPRAPRTTTARRA